MIVFTVQGHPIPQGSLTPFCPVSPNADIDEAISHLISLCETPERDEHAIFDRFLCRKGISASREPPRLDSDRDYHGRYVRADAEALWQSWIASEGSRCRITPKTKDAIDALTNRLAAIGKWPAYQQHKPGAKTPGHFVATMRASNATRLNKWRAAIAKAAREAYKGEPVHKCGVSVAAVYYFRRPKVHYRSGKYSHLLRDDAPVRHYGKPDRDKLNRAVGDALTGIIFADDSQDCEGESWKRWRDNRDEPEGAKITICFEDEL